jgi:hypothetical protein
MGLGILTRPITGARLCICFSIKPIMNAAKSDSYALTP